MISVSGGMCGYIAPGRENEQGYFSDASAAIKKTVSVPVLLTGGITELSAAEELISGGSADLIGIGRPVYKDSEWLAKEVRKYI